MPIKTSAAAGEDNPAVWVVYSTFPSRAEAISAAKSLVEKRLIACANVQDGATSVYRWEGKTHEDSETVLIAKTSAAMLDAAIAALRALHSYELPCISAWPVQAGLPEYLTWVEEQTA